MSTAVQGQVEAGAAGRRGSRLVEVAFRVRELGILAALALVVIVTTAVNPRFLSVQSIRDLLLNASIIALLTVGQTLVVVTRNVDLSVGSVLGLAAFMTGDLLAGHQCLPNPSRSGHRDVESLRHAEIPSRVSSLYSWN